MATSRRRSGKRRRKAPPSNSNGLLIGMLIGGGVAALIAVAFIAFKMGQTTSTEVASTPSNTGYPPYATPDTSTEIEETETTNTPMETNVADEQLMSTNNVEPVESVEPAEVVSTNLPPSNDPNRTDSLDTPSSPGKSSDGPPQPSSVELSLPDLIERVEKSVVRIVVKSELGGSLGSGFVVDKAGTIVTNYHVIEGAESAKVEFANGTKADVVGVYSADHELDLAVLKIDLSPADLHPLPVAAAIPRKGIRVATFGAPRGLSFSNSEGIISGIRSAKEVGHAKGTYVQTTAAISGGNSGGPLVDMFGSVVGVNTFKRLDGESLNFAISSTDVQEMVEKKGEKLATLNPQNVPVKISGGYGGAENLVGTEKGRILLSQIREVVIITAPFNQDPSGRITDYVENVAERTFERKLEWRRVSRSRDLKPSTAIIVVAMYFTFTEGAEEDLVSDLNVHTVILSRDVDKDGTEITAIVYNEKDTVGTVALRALLSGIISRTMESGIQRYFNSLVGEYRKAVRAVQ